MALSTLTNSVGQITQTKTISGTFSVTSSTTQSASTNITCNVCCKQPNQHLIGWFGGYPNTQGLCPEALPEWAPLDFFNNGIPVYGTFNLTATGAYSLEDLCLPDTWTVYFKNPWNFPGRGQTLVPDGFVPFTPQTHYCYAGYYTPGETAPEFEMKTLTPNFYWPYEDKGDYFFILRQDGNASMTFRACSCLPPPNGNEFQPIVLFKLGTMPENYTGQEYVPPEESSTCTPFSMVYSGVFYYGDYETALNVKLGDFTVTFTF